MTTTAEIAEARRERNQKDLDTYRGIFAELLDKLQEQIDNDTLDHIDVQQYVPIVEITQEGDEWVGRKAVTAYRTITLHIVSREPTKTNEGFCNCDCEPCAYCRGGGG